MARSKKNPTKLRAPVGRAVHDERADLPSQRVVMGPVGKRFGTPRATLDGWVRRAKAELHDPSESEAANPKQKQPETSKSQQTSGVVGSHVFLSYSRNDRGYVTKLADWLEGHGVKVWFDHDIDYGTRWKAEILKQLDASTVVLVVMSKSARKSSWVAREVERAKERQILVVPILLDPDGIVDQLADLQFDNVVGGQMPDLRLCQNLPGFLVSEKDIASALTPEQRDIAQRIASSAGGALRRGSKGPGVAALQTELLRVGLDPGPINGVFGEKTARAVRDFQRRRCHLPTADGIVGPVTWMILTNSSLGDLAPSAPGEKEQREHPR